MAATCPIDFDVASLRESVRAVYTRVAANPSGDFHFHRGLDYAVEQLSYDRRELAALPRASTERFAGVGPALGETVRSGRVPSCGQPASVARCPSPSCSSS
jgi:arsenite methyltransferase